MYLPTFYKLANEKIAQRLLRYGTFGAPVALWGQNSLKLFFSHNLSLGVWSMWPSIYNMIYTDFIPPERGRFYSIIFESHHKF